MLKQRTYRSKAWLAAVRLIEDCVHCGTHGTQAAHRNKGKGMAVKSSDALTAALCPFCHRDLDQGSSLSHEERRTLMDEAILATIDELARRGLIGPIGPK